jgi:hypothetical protein
LDGVIHGGAGVAMKASLLSGLKQLEIAGHGEKCVAAVDGVFIFNI